MHKDRQWCPLLSNAKILLHYILPSCSNRWICSTDRFFHFLIGKHIDIIHIIWIRDVVSHFPSVRWWETNMIQNTTSRLFLPEYMLLEKLKPHKRNFHCRSMVYSLINNVIMEIIIPDITLYVKVFNPTFLALNFICVLSPCPLLTDSCLTSWRLLGLPRHLSWWWWTVLVRRWWDWHSSLGTLHTRGMCLVEYSILVKYSSFIPQFYLPWFLQFLSCFSFSVIVNL